ncbi:MAG: hypothetical protein AMXMBFR33_01510 [Candidatus Xenobia bacterium]
MRIVILCPRRAGIPERDLIWERLKKRWALLHPKLRVYEGHHDRGPFNRSAAINRAARAADRDGRWHFAVIIDSDIFIPVGQLEAALKRARTTGRVTWAFRRWRGLDRASTDRLVRDQAGLLAQGLDGADLDHLVEKTNPLSWSCCFVVPRPVWDDLGGFDERFRGWGWEDMAFQSAVCGLHGHERIDGDVFHLWHPLTPERGKRNGRYQVDFLRNSILGRRYMVALRRDMGQTEREDTWPPKEDLARDIANLERESTAAEAQLGGSEWTGKWPTLRELVDDWKAVNRGVTVVVHTDRRREYIARAVPSLVEQVRGPIVRRVFYDDSGDAAYKQWLMEQFGRFGFYVVGPAERLGYTGSMRAMWSYLRRRCNSGYVFQTEDDFTFDVPIDLDRMIDILQDQPHLSQLALLRHPYYPRELAAGSIIAEHPEAYTKCEVDGARWLEHRLYWTCNPSLFRRSLCETPWPDVKSSERGYTDVLNRDPANRMAYWGHGEELVTHIGAERAGNNY